MPHPFQSYEILERIAVGGMGEVFKANAISANGTAVPVVIKKILPQYASDEGFRDLFVNEARVAAKLRHPNIVRMLDLGRMDKHLFIALEFIDGGDLWQINEHLEKIRQPILLHEAIYIAVEVLKGLHCAHTADEQVVHRDLSPANVMITRSGSVKVTDFGIAKTRFRSVQTVRGQLKGNVRYMAPEQITGEDEIDPRTDVYQVGLLLWTLIAGRHPFHGLPFGEAIDRTVKGDIPRIGTIDGKVPAGIANAITTATERLPDLRFQSAQEFQLALQESAAEAELALTGDTLAVRIAGFAREGEEQHQVISRKSFDDERGASVFSTLSGEKPRSEPSPAPSTLPGVRLEGHEAEVTALAVTPDGMLAFSGSVDRTARAWDLVSHRQVHVLLGHVEPVTAVDISAGGALGASVSMEGEMRVWHLDSGEQIWCTMAHDGAANALALAADGRVAITAGEDGLVKVWDLVAERCAAVLRAGVPIVSLSLNSTGLLVAAGQRDGDVRLFDVARRAERLTMHVGEGPVRAVALESSGSIILASCGQTVAICRPSSGKITPFQRHRDPVCSLAIAPAGLAVSAGTSGTIKLWNVRDQSEVRTFKAHDRPVLALRVLADGSLFSASADGSIGIWQLPNRS